MTEWSRLQEAIFDFAKTRSDNLAVIARAGTGKSTTIRELCARLKPRRVLVCAFNNKIRDDLAEKLRTSPHVTVKGLNQMGFGTAIKRLNRTLEVDRWRIQDYVRKRVPDFYKDARGEVAKLVTMCMVTLSTTPEAIENCMYEYDLRPLARTEQALWVDWVMDTLEWSLRTDHATISFTEQVYIPAVLNLSTGSYDVVIVDEAQDLSPAQLRLVVNATRPGGRIIAVGDPAQAIYHFNGASADSMDKIIIETGAHTLPLSITYRCPTEVVRLVKPLVPDYESGPGAPRGVVDSVGGKEFYKRVAEGDVVISRTNAALTKVALELIASGKRARIVGKDIGAQLEKLVGVGTQGVDSIKDMLTSLTDYVAEESEKLEAARKEDKAEELRDNLDALRALSSNCSDLYGVRSKITSLFNDEDVTRGTIPCMSTHKAKGLEFDRVWQLETTFNPKGADGANCYYVAATRAKKELMLVQIPKSDGSTGRSWAKDQGFFKTQGKEESDE